MNFTSVFFGIFGFLSMVVLAGLCMSRYFGRVVIGILQRQGHRLSALRCFWRAGSEEYSRSLEFQRLQGRILE